MALRNVPITPGSGDNVRFDGGNQIVKQAYGAEGVETLMDEKPASDAKLTTIVTALADLLAELQAKTEPGQTQAVSAASLPLPAGAATAAAQAAAAADGLPLAGEAINYQPGYHPASEGGGKVATDPSGNLVTRSQVVTDEGSFRANFSGASLAISIGTCTFTNGSAVVTGTNLTSYDLHSGDYVKLDADAATAWTQVESFDSPTQLTLVSAYPGTGGTGASSCDIVKPVVGTGGSITVSSGQATIACGTTAAVTHELERDVDYGPLLFQTGLSVSQRIANQDIYVGLYDEEHAATPYYYAWFRINGVTNTTVICESGQKRDGAPSGGELETTTVTLPNGQTTATARRWRIEVMLAKLRFYIDGVLVAEHYKAMPRPMDKLTATVRCVNGTTPASGTNVIVDYMTAKNFNTVDITIPGETEGVVANQPPLDLFSFSQAGAVTINTDLLIIDCRQYRSLMLQCTSMGTSGVVTVAWSNNNATWVTATLYSESGATSTTFNAAVLRTVNVQARYCRLRLTTGASGGTTTIFVHASQFALTPAVTTQPISGSVSLASNQVITPVPQTGQGSSTAHRTAFVANITTGVPSARVANNSGTAVWFHIYNKASAPTLGTNTPEASYFIKAGDSLVLNCGPFGERFATGIAYAICDNCAVIPVAGGSITIASTATAICVSARYT